MSLTDELWAAFFEKGLVKSREEFLEKHDELYRAHPEIVEEVAASRRAAKERPLAEAAPGSEGSREEQISPLAEEQK